MRTKITAFCILIMICVVTAFGCNSTSTVRHRNTATQAQTDSGKEKTVLGVITDIDDVNGNIAFNDLDSNEACIFAYNKGTEVVSKSDRVISIAQINEGDVVDITYDTGSHMIHKLKISDNDKVWENTKVTSFSFDDTTNSMKVGQSLYSYSDNVVVVSGDILITVSEITSEDQLIVRGYGNRIASIVVDKGHGYVTLSGDGLFIGGLIDIGGTVVKVIEEDMLLIVREGTYKVEVANGNYRAEKYITVNRNEECTVDFSDVAAEVIEIGNVKFNIDVDGAVLTVDGVKTDYSAIVQLKTGTHTITVAADGYDTYTEKIDITLTYQVVDINLSESEETTTNDSGETETTTAVSQENETVVSKTNKVTISGPENAIVYFDSTYKGIAPVTFAMITGTHTITIIDDGNIKSYTVNLAEGGDDVTYDYTDK